MPIEFFITADSESESGVSPIITEISGPTLSHFSERAYGSGLRGICVALICQDPKLQLKRRLRFARGEQQIYMDIMLDLAEMKRLDHAGRKKLVCGRLLDEVPAVLRKYRVPEFETERFISDLNSWVTGLS